MKFGSNRRYQDWPGHEQCYRSGLHQPAPAIIAIVFGSLLLFFNGWDTIFQAVQPGADASDLAAGLIKSYLGPTIFATLFFVHKYKHGRSMVTFREVRDALDEIANVPEDQSNEPPRETVPWKRFLKAIM
jgi:amino acid permease